jgi:formiminotetrahydrofolate cyclodeaminase
MYQEEPVKKYLDDLAAKLPAPGGGSAAALAGSMGAALLSMVANFTAGKEKYKGVEEQIKRALASSEELRFKLVKLVDDDVAAYQKASQVFRLPPAEKEKRLEGALKEAMAVPLEVCRLCHSGLLLSKELVDIGNVNLVSDVGVAVCLFEAGFQSAFLNVEINLKGIKDAEFAARTRGLLDQMANEVPVIKTGVWEKTKSKMV